MPVLLIIFFLIGILLVIKVVNTVTKVNSHWQHYFDDLTYSSQDFYRSVEKILQEKQIPDSSTKRITYSETGLFSANREYLRVERGSMIFDICAAPFARGFFISSWQGELPNILQQFISSIPFIGSYLERVLFNKTYYQLDFEEMFINAVHTSVLEAIKAITDDMGVRDLTETERMYNKIGK